MSDMKCPFCGDEMKLTNLYMDGNHRYSHKYIGGLNGGKDRCPLDGETLPLCALQEIHRTRKALDVALCSLQDIAESDGDFITGASTPLDEHEYADMMLKEIKRQMKIKTALEQIIAEQKDK